MGRYQRMTPRRMADRYKCSRCGCRLDPAELPLCDECREEQAAEEAQRRFFGMTAEDQRAAKAFLAG